MPVMILKLRLNFEVDDFGSYFLYALLPIVTPALLFRRNKIGFSYDWKIFRFE